MLKGKKSLTSVILLILTCALLLIGGCAKSGNDTEATPPSQTDGTDAAAPTQSTTPSQKSTSPTPDEPTDEPPDVPDEPTGGVSSGEQIGFITQEYDGDNIVEIPYIEYDGEMNPEIESINRLFNQGLQFAYEEFLEVKQEHEWIEIRSYPFTTDKYLQLVITDCVYPNYGTDGDIESVNYDRIAKKWLTIEDALDIMGLSESDVSFGVSENYDPEVYGGLIAELKIAGFLIRDTQDGERIELLLTLAVEGEDVPWQGFFSYMPDGNDLTNDLTQLSGECLFDPYDMDQMNPPLAYQQ